MGDIKWDGPGYYMKDGGDWLKIDEAYAFAWSQETPVAYYESLGDYRYGIEYCPEALESLIELLAQEVRDATTMYERHMNGFAKAWNDMVLMKNSIKVLIKEVLDEQ